MVSWNQLKLMSLEERGRLIEQFEAEIAEMDSNDT